MIGRVSIGWTEVITLARAREKTARHFGRDPEPRSFSLHPPTHPSLRFSLLKLLMSAAPSSCPKGVNCCGGNASGQAQALPAREGGSKSAANKDSLWPIQRASSSSSSRSASPSRSLSAVQDVLREQQESDPLATKCGVPDGGVCCKELKGDDERTLVDPDIVRFLAFLIFPLLSSDLLLLSAVLPGPRRHHRSQ